MLLLKQTHKKISELIKMNNTIRLNIVMLAFILAIFFNLFFADALKITDCVEGGVCVVDESSVINTSNYSFLVFELKSGVNITLMADNGGGYHAGYYKHYYNNTGGGKIQIFAKNITIEGDIYANAPDVVPGTYNGGPSGGSIYLYADIINISGKLVANGGNAISESTGYLDCGWISGGGGAAGSIFIIGNKNYISGLISANGGATPGDGYATAGRGAGREGGYGGHCHTSVPVGGACYCAQGGAGSGGNSCGGSYYDPYCSDSFEECRGSPNDRNYPGIANPDRNVRIIGETISSGTIESKSGDGVPDGLFTLVGTNISVAGNITYYATGIRIADANYKPIINSTVIIRQSNSSGRIILAGTSDLYDGVVKNQTILNASMLYWILITNVSDSSEINLIYSNQTGSFSEKVDTKGCAGNTHKTTLIGRNYDCYFKGSELIIADLPPFIFNVTPANGTDRTPMFNFTTNENAWCKISLEDQGLNEIPGPFCMGLGTTSHSCQITTPQDIGTRTYYIACRDSSFNAHTSETNYHHNYTVFCSTHADCNSSQYCSSTRDCKMKKNENQPCGQTMVYDNLNYDSMCLYGHCSAVAGNVCNAIPLNGVPQKLSNITTNTQLLNWTAGYDPIDNIYYDVRIGTTPGASDKGSANLLTTTEWLATGLDKVGKYYWAVRTCDDYFQCSTWSPDSYFYVLNSPPIIHSIFIKPSSPKSTDDLVCFWNFTDPENNTLNFTVYWYRKQSRTYPTCVGDTTTGEWTISSNYTIINDIECKVIKVTNNASLIVDSLNKSGQIIITAENITIDPGSSISATAKGYPGGCDPGEWGGGPGGGHSTSNCACGGGGGYGGQGKDAYACSFPPIHAPGGPAYGNYTAPIDLGSGGGSGHYVHFADNFGGCGGAGGGSMKIIASQLVVDGKITCNGERGHGDPRDSVYHGGGGSGGSIWINTKVLSGNGLITANGGSGHTPLSNGDHGGGAGAGGRIAIYYGALNDFNISTQVSVEGGEAGQGGKGNPGTVYYKEINYTDSDLFRAENVTCTGVPNICNSSKIDNSLVNPGDSWKCVVSVDDFGNHVSAWDQVTIAKTFLESINVTLHKGWNLISLPLMPTDSNGTKINLSADKLLEWLNATIIAAYNSSLQRYTTYIKGVAGTNFMLNTDTAYYVFVNKSNLSVSFRGLPITNFSKVLKPGWNFINYPDITLANSLLGRSFHYTDIIWYNRGYFSKYTRRGDGINFQTSPGKGIMIYVDATSYFNYTK